MCSKSIPNIIKIGQKSTQKWAFGVPWGRLGSQTGKGCLFPHKLEPKGSPNGAMWAPWGSQQSIKHVKNTSKIQTGIRAWKSQLKVWIWDPPEPQKVGFRVRGVQIFTNPPKPLKVTKKAPKELQNESKMEPRGPKRAPQDPQKPTKKQRGKKRPTQT